MNFELEPRALQSSNTADRCAVGGELAAATMLCRVLGDDGGWRSKMTSVRGPRSALGSGCGSSQVVGWIQMRNMMPGEIFPRRDGIGCWFKSAVPVVVSLFKIKMVLAEVKEEREACAHEGPLLFLPGKRRPRMRGGRSQRGTYCIILHNPNKITAEDAAAARRLAAASAPLSHGKPRFLVKR